MRLVATYVGGMDGAVMPLRSGRTLTLLRDTPTEVLASEVEQIDAHPECTVHEDGQEQEQEQAQQDPPATHDEDLGGLD